MIQTTFRLSVLSLLVWVCAQAAVAQPFVCDGVEPVAGDGIALELVSNRLSSPVDVAAPPGDTERLFVVEQLGRIRIIELADDCLRCLPFLNIQSRVMCCGERGLLGLAFHPDYAENGYFFVYYTRNPDGATVVARYTAMANDPNLADPGSEEVFITFAQPAGNHNGGQIAFGPNDGYLYIATGDGGSGCDRSGSGNNAQNRGSFLGKLLRIDVDKPAGASDYSIPPDNPFTEVAGARPEIWSLGLRNPWRVAFDPGALDGSGLGDLYIADVGQNVYEEINYRPGTSAGGENYEWVVKEADHSSTASGCTPTSLTLGTAVAPVYEYTHGSGALKGCSITGGKVYRGCRMPDLHGSYFFADYCNDWIGTLRIEEGAVTDVRNRTAELNAGISPGTVGDVSAFGTDARGEMYVCDIGSPGQLFRIVPAGTSDNSNSSCIGPAACITRESSPLQTRLSGGFAEVELDGRCSCGSRATNLWEKLSGPDGDGILSPDTELTGVTFTEPGEYTYRLTVTDEAGNSDAAVVSVVVEPPLGPEFRRGDANADAIGDISDGVYVLVFLFAGGDPLGCDDAGDTNDDGSLDMSDAIYLFSYLFTGGPAPPAPGAIACGIDETSEDPLGCASHPPCGV